MRTISHYPRSAGKTTEYLDAELKRTQGWVSAAESRYARLDKRRLREHLEGGVTEETATEYRAAVMDLDKACSVHAAVLEKRKQLRKTKAP